MSILTEYSLWFGLLCLLLGAIYAAALYFRYTDIEFDKRAHWTMAILRGVAISMIAFLLLSPMIRRNVKEIDKPLLIFAIDNSESMVCTKDSAFYRNDFQKQMNQLIHSFGNKYDIKTYFIGDQNEIIDNEEDITIPFTQKITNISALFNEVENVYSQHNVGAMILVSDGIFNAGSNPQYQIENLKFPVYTICAGDTTAPTDLCIADVIHNKQTYIGNFFPVEIKIDATQLAGQKAQLTVSHKGQEVFSKSIDIHGNNHYETVKLVLEAKEKGMQKYSVEISELPKEITYKNNVNNFFINVVDSKEKIAIVYAAPHPDVSAIKQAIDLSDKYEVETFAADEFNKNIHDYSLFIFHQLPSQKKLAGKLLSDVQKQGISSLYIIGNQTDIKEFNNLGAGVTVTPSGSNGQYMMNDATPHLNNNFLLFTFSEEAQQMLKYYTPISTFFGNYKIAGGANTFLYQKINKVETNYPLITFHQNNRQRVGVITGTGIWNWRIQNYLHVQNFEAFDEIINKMALYLSVKGDKSNFRINIQEVYDENTPIELSAEVYTESYELINTPDVRFTLTDGAGKEFTSLFSKRNNSYYLNLGKLPVGDYSWTASTIVGNTTYTKSGNFAVQEIQLESMNLIANHNLLQVIAEQSQGKSFSINEIEQVEKAVKDNENIKSVVTYNKKYSSILNSWIYFVIIILLLGIEWFMRKWSGGY